MPIKEAMPNSFTPPKAVQQAAKRGLELRKKHGRGGLTPQEAGKQGIGSGVARAVTLARGKPIPLKTIKRMRSYFARHEVDKKGKNWANPDNPSNGYIAWLLWGGDPGKKWADAIVKESKRKESLDEASNKEKSPAIKKKLAKKGLSKLNRECSLDAFKHNIRREYHAGQTAQGTQHVAIALSVLKRSCGVDSKDRMTPKEIVAAGGKRESMNVESINSVLVKAIGRIQENEIEDINESRPGPHWNPHPQKKTKESEFIKSLVDIARVNNQTGLWSQKTTDIVASAAWHMKKNDKAKVKKLWKMLGNQSDVSPGLVNEINHWLMGWMD